MSVDHRREREQKTRIKNRYMYPLLLAFLLTGVLISIFTNRASGDPTVVNVCLVPMPVLYFTQLMAVALGLSEAETALNKDLVYPRPLLLSKGILAPTLKK